MGSRVSASQQKRRLSCVCPWWPRPQPPLSFWLATMALSDMVWLPEARGPTSQCPSPSRVRSGLPARPRASVPQLPPSLPPTPSATPPSLALLATLDRELLLEELPTVLSDMDSPTELLATLLPALSSMLPLLSTLPPLTMPLLPTLLPRCTPTRSPPTSSSTPLPTTTPDPTSRLPRLTTALLP